MAEKLFLADIDLLRNQLKNVVIHLVATVSVLNSPTAGMLVFDQSDLKLKYFDGTQWVVLGSKEWVEDVVGALIQDSNSISAQYDDAAGQLRLHLVRKQNVASFEGRLGVDSAGVYVVLGIGSGDVALPGDVRLNQILPPVGDVDIASKRLLNVADPVNDLDAANKRYVDAARLGLDAKESVRVATTSDIVLSGTAIIDGVNVSEGDRVLVRAQNNAAENGIYEVRNSTWNRATDADSWDKLVGAFVFVEEGNTFADVGFLCTIDRGGTLGSDPVSWVRFSSLNYTAGDGIEISSNVISARTTGLTTGIVQGRIAVKSSQTAGQVLISSGSSQDEAFWGAVDLSSNAAVTGILPVSQGGTGATNPRQARVNLSAASVEVKTLSVADNQTLTVSFTDVDCSAANFFFYDQQTGKSVEVDFGVNSSSDIVMHFARVGSITSLKIVAVGLQK